MRWFIVPVALLAVGCASRSATPSTSSSPEVSAQAQVIEAFAGVVNLDGTARSKADLLGHPTVVWFFPFAGTPG